MYTFHSELYYPRARLRPLIGQTPATYATSKQDLLEMKSHKALFLGFNQVCVLSVCVCVCDTVCVCLCG
jgi:hypothetical protein